MQRRAYRLAVAFAALLMLAGVGPATAFDPDRPVLQRVKYYCSLGISASRVLDACGTKVCRYLVGCEDISDQEDLIEGEAYCPLIDGECAPYSACEIPPEKTAELINKHFAGQCDKFSKPPGSAL